ncbi:MAG TPA: hypothetical protein VFJ85_15870 [Acidimicrobiales bacterium]|nr:hypothetical protein [Acidimicrobiales bacterium]
MPPYGPELLALALALSTEGVPEDEAVGALIDTAQCRATSLMGACAYALKLAEDRPYDASSERIVILLTRALQQAVRMSGEQPSNDRAILLEQIVEFSGRASLAPGAVASRTAEVDADLENLRAAVGREPTAT